MAVVIAACVATCATTRPESPMVGASYGVTFAAATTALLATNAANCGASTATCVRIGANCIGIVTRTRSHRKTKTPSGRPDGV